MICVIFELPVSVHSEIATTPTLSGCHLGLKDHDIACMAGSSKGRGEGKVKEREGKEGGNISHFSSIALRALFSLPFRTGVGLTADLQIGTPV